MTSEGRARLRDAARAAWRAVIINATALGGLAAIGYGLFIWVHPGAAFVVVGAILLAGAVAGSLRTPTTGQPGEAA